MVPFERVRVGHERIARKVCPRPTGESSQPRETRRAAAHGVLGETLMTSHVANASGHVFCLKESRQSY
jgi:hypothetical protein